MTPQTTALLFIAGGAVIFMIGCLFFAHVRGGLFSFAGVLAAVPWLVGLALILAGFGLVPMPAVLG